MVVFYRLCHVKSPTSKPSPIYADDLLKLNELCLKSFVEAYKSLNPRVIFICDKCPLEYDKMVQSVVPFKYELFHTALGINETCLLQYEMALKEKEVILFQECDYLYKGDASVMETATEMLGVVSPYDNLNFYLDRQLHSRDSKIELVGDYHFRTTERNTMTFAIRDDLFKANYQTFKKYGYLDGDVWYDLKEAGDDLWVPIPSLATHMVEEFMAPSVSWESIWKTYIK